MAIAREAQLMFSHMPSFKPIGNELTRWKGDIVVQTSSGERNFPVEVFIPLKYPQYPPKVLALIKDIQHPNIEKNGNILLRITHNWKPDTHVYQVVQEVKQLFRKVPPIFKGESGVKVAQKKAQLPDKGLIKTENQQQVDTANKTITDLQDKIKKRDEELRKLRADLVRGSSTAVRKVEDTELVLPKNKAKSQELLVQAKNVAVADLLSTLDEKFKDGEISPVDFAKLYRKYSKELYLLQKELENK